MSVRQSVIIDSIDQSNLRLYHFYKVQRFALIDRFDFAPNPSWTHERHVSFDDQFLTDISLTHGGREECGGRQYYRLGASVKRPMKSVLQL
jgi:hypothetical protein